MNYLVDTHLILWAAVEPERLPAEAPNILASTGNHLYVSAASLWEVAVKQSLNRPDFQVQVGPLRAGLRANGYEELPVAGRHVITLPGLPMLHKDPFDRLLLAQAIADGFLLLPADRDLARYGGPVRFVGKSSESG